MLAEGLESGERRQKLRVHEYREYRAGERFYRKRNPMREFKSLSEKEKYKIARKLQARYEGPYMVTERINPVLYEADVAVEIRCVSSGGGEAVRRSWRSWCIDALFSKL